MRAEGWSWVEILQRVSSDELHTFQRARRSHWEPIMAEAQRIEKLAAERASLQDKLNDEDDDLSNESMQALQESMDRLGNELTAIEQN